jgi:uncharacterized spore protein YtfJ
MGEHRLEIGHAEGIAPQADAAAQPIRQMLEKLGVETAFGKPLREGETTCIPVAEVRTRFAYAVASRPQRGAPEASAQRSQGQARVKPRGFLKIGPAGIAFEPIMNITLMGVAGIALTAWMVFWITRTIRVLKRTKGGAPFSGTFVASPFSVKAPVGAGEMREE